MFYVLVVVPLRVGGGGAEQKEKNGRKKYDPILVWVGVPRPK